MALYLASLPTAVAGAIQDGLLEKKLYESLRPMLLWRGLCSQERHPGQIGERVTKTRDGLIQPDDATTALRSPSSDPGSVTRSLEQFGYQIKPYGKTIDCHLPSSWLAQENRFLSDSGALAFHAAQTMGRICRDAILAAYGGGNTFATTGATSTSLVVQSAVGFDTVMVNGAPVAVSVSNPGTLTLGSTSYTYTAVNLGTNTITLSSSQTWSQYDAVVRSDAARVVRQTSRATDRLIVAGDTPTIATFREAAAYMRTHNVPGIDGVVGGLYGCFVDPHVENALFADAEFHDAVNAQAITGQLAEGVVGTYAGIKFIRQTEMPTITATAPYQATIHRSLVFGAEVAIEAFIPESEFQNQVPAEGIATTNHYKTALDPAAVMSMVVRAPMDKAGQVLSLSWLSNADYCIPTDSKALTGTQRFKRAVVVHTAGPA